MQITDSIFDSIVKVQETMIDYPGKIGLMLYVDKCNLRCNYCYNLLQLAAEQPIPFSNIETQLIAGKKLYQSVIISGGEPTIYSDLPQLIKLLIDIGYSVKVDTNGNNYDRILNAHYVAIDYKWPRDLYKKYTGSIPEDLSAVIAGIGKEYKGEIRTVITPFHQGLVDAMKNELVSIIGNRGITWNISKYYDCMFTFDREPIVEAMKTMNLDMLVLEYRKIAREFLK